MINHLTIHFEQINGDTVCRIDVRPSIRAVFVRSVRRVCSSASEQADSREQTAGIQSQGVEERTPCSRSVTDVLASNALGGQCLLGNPHASLQKMLDRRAQVRRCEPGAQLGCHLRRNRFHALPVVVG